MGLVKPVSPVLQRDLPLARGLAGSWPFHEGVGGIAHDLSGLPNDGTLNGSMPWVGGAFGSALSFNGSSQYVSIGAGAVVAYPFTMTCWFKTNDVTNVTTLMSYGLGTNDFDRMFIYGPHSTHLALQSQLGGASSIPEVAITLQAGVWYFATGVFLSTASRTAYLNAANPATDTTNISHGTPNKLWVGRNDNSPADEYFNGVIDDPRVYNRALSQNEIAALYFDSFVIYRTRSRWWMLPPTETPAPRGWFDAELIGSKAWFG